MSHSIRNTTSKTFSEDVSAAKQAVLVDFYADWCGPCQALTPIVEDIAVAFGDKLDVVKINVDNEPRLAEQFGVRSIPTLAVFKEGSPVETIVGLVSKEQLTTTLLSHL